MPLSSQTATTGAHETLEAMERAYIVRVLEATGWQVEGEGGAARVLGLNPSTLRGRLRKLDIRRS
jgi:transcriptional regulator with GAF, ATPase, and Fis domain